MAVSISLQDLMLCAQRMLAQGDRVRQIEEQLKEEKAKYHLIEQTQLPNAMFELGMSTFTLSDGRLIELKRKIECGVTDENMPAAREWLTEHKLNGIIKHQVITEFGKGEDELARDILGVIKQALLDAAQKDASASVDDYLLKVQDKESIHYQTLAATIRKCIEAGTDVPEGPFGLFIIDQAKVKVPK